jgi:hypothetical protein
LLKASPDLASDAVIGAHFAEPIPFSVTPVAGDAEGTNSNENTRLNEAIYGGKSRYGEYLVPFSAHSMRRGRGRLVGTTERSTWHELLSPCFVSPLPYYFPNIRSTMNAHSPTSTPEKRGVSS